MSHSVSGLPVSAFSQRTGFGCEVHEAWPWMMKVDAMRVAARSANIRRFGRGATERRRNRIMDTPFLESCRAARIVRPWKGKAYSAVESFMRREMSKKLAANDA